jgi:hypothetical protein
MNPYFVGAMGVNVHRLLLVRLRASCAVMLPTHLLAAFVESALAPPPEETT